MDQLVLVAVVHGQELGARRAEPECYVNGRADYSLITRTPAFMRGLERIIHVSPIQPQTK